MMQLRGWLYKRGIKGPTANVWRNRYFRCDQGNKIYYYKAADEPTPKGLARDVHVYYTHTLGYIYRTETQVSVSLFNVSRE